MKNPRQSPQTLAGVVVWASRYVRPEGSIIAVGDMGEAAHASQACLLSTLLTYHGRQIHGRHIVIRHTSMPVCL